MKPKQLFATIAVILAIFIATPCVSAYQSTTQTSTNESAFSIVGVYDTSDDVNNFRNFCVDVKEDGEYHVSFWLLPSMYENGTFSQFSIYTNGEYSGLISAKRGNWQSASPDNDDMITLHKGLNTISISTCDPEIPEVETLNIGMDDSEISSEEYDDYLAEAMSGHNLEIAEDINIYTTNAFVKPDFFWDLELRYSFFKKVSFTKNQEIFITTSSDKDHYIDVMFCGRYVDKPQNPSPDPDRPIFQSIDIGTPTPVEIKTFEYATSEEMQGMNWGALSSKTYGSTKKTATCKITIPETGVYLIRVRTLNNAIQGTVNIHIDNKFYYENNPISLSYKDCIIPADGIEYASMTNSDNNSVDDPMIFIHSYANDHIVGWNDNGKYSELKENNLGSKEAYISQIYKVKTKGISISSAKSSTPISKCDVIARMAVGNGESTNAKSIPMKTVGSLSVNSITDTDRINIPASIKLGESLTIDSDIDISRISIFNMEGKLNFSDTPNDKHLNIGTSSMNINSKGIYLISIVTENGIISKRIIVR